MKSRAKKRWFALIILLLCAVVIGLFYWNGQKKIQNDEGYLVKYSLLFTPVSITPLIDTEDACFDLNASRPIAKGDLKWRDALLVAHCVNSNGKDLVSDGEKTVDIYQTSFYTNHVKKTRGACVPG